MTRKQAYRPAAATGARRQTAADAVSLARCMRDFAAKIERFRVEARRQIPQRAGTGKQP